MLQVNDPEKYGFFPKALLNFITDIYIHLDSQQLARAVASDEVMVVIIMIFIDPVTTPISDCSGRIVRRCLRLASLS